MDQKVCEASKRLNAIKYDADQKTDRLKELQDSLRQMRIVDTRDIDLQRQQVSTLQAREYTTVLGL